jgi:NADP-dependent 3-hydroxy acid dehydrogenase YdfG
MTSTFAGKVAVVTGGSAGIAKRFARMPRRHECSTGSPEHVPGGAG